MSFDPVQCPEYGGDFLNRWSNVHNNATYPVGQGNNETSIKNYYQKQEITIYDLRDVRWPDVGTCAACGCPTLHTLYLLVSNSDVDKMQKFGYSVVLGQINQGNTSPVNGTGNKTLNNDAISIVSIQPSDKQGNPVSTFTKETNGFVKLILSSRENQTALVTVSLVESDLTNFGIGSIKTSVNQQASQIVLSFYIPDYANNGIANIYVNAYSDWPEKGGIPLVKESSTIVKIGNLEIK